MNKQGYINLEDRLLKLIQETKSTREELNIIPTFTLRTAAAISFGVSRKQIERAAKILEEQGKIRIGDTIRDKYYELVLEDKSES